MSGSTTVFLKSGDLSLLTGYELRRWNTKEFGPQSQVKIFDFEIRGGNEKPYLVVNNCSAGELPETLKEQILRVNTQEIFTSNPRRERGRYELDDAKGLLELSNGKDYNLVCDGPTVEGCLALVEAVKRGSIRPIVSYEQVQGGKSAQELEREMRELEKEYEGTCNRFGEALQRAESAECCLKALQVAARGLYQAIGLVQKGTFFRFSTSKSTRRILDSEKDRVASLMGR